MMELKKETASQIIDKIDIFLRSQLGENPKSVTCHLNNNILAIYANGAISPAEQLMLNSENDNNILLEYKKQQFESVKDELCREINQLMENKVNHIISTITDDGMRIINIFLIKKNLKQ